MKRMSLEKELIRTDYSGADIPDSVKNFRPDIYRDGAEFYAILGSDENAIVGIGSSVTEAMKNWDTAYWNKRYNKNKDK